MIRIAFLTTLLFFLRVTSLADEFTAATLDYTEVSGIVASMVDDDILNLPSGDTTWSSQISITKRLKIRGVIDGTTIRMPNNRAFHMNNVDGFVIADITFIHSGTSTSGACIQAQGQGWAVAYCRFESGNNTKKFGVYPSGLNTTEHPNGLIWRCSYYKMRTDVQGGGAVANPPGGVVSSKIWSGVSVLGTTNNIYFEDCNFEQVAATLHNSTDSEYAGCYVARFCTYTNTTAEFHSNGSSVSPTERAARSTEIYGCTFVQNGVTMGSNPIFGRGGTFGMFSNSATGTWPGSAIIKLDCERGFSGAGDGGSNRDGNQAISNHGTGTHTGSSGASVLTDSTATWSTSELVTGTGVEAFWIYNLTDGSKGQITANTATTVTATLTGGTDNDWDAGDSYLITGGYPLRDQLGTEQDAFEWVTSTTTPPSQTLRPGEYTGNTMNGSPSGVSIGSSSSYWLKDGRDVTNSAPTYTLLAYPHPLVAALDLENFANGGGASPPTITEIADQEIDQDTDTGAIAFTVGDGETAAGDLTLSKGSSDTTLVPLSGIVFGGSGASRTVTVTPAAGLNGSANVTVTVTDGDSETASEVFQVTVNSVGGNTNPTISDLANQTFYPGSDSIVEFTVGDAETALSSLGVVPTSSDQRIVPNAALSVLGTGAARVLSVDMGLVRPGTATITVTVTDGGSLTAVDTFTLTIPGHVAKPRSARKR
jgi:hypothetical protein